MADIRENNGQGQCWTDYMSGGPDLGRHDRMMDPHLLRANRAAPAVSKPEFDVPVNIRDLLSALSGKGSVGVAVNGELYWSGGFQTYRGYAPYQLQKLDSWGAMQALAATHSDGKIRKFFGV
jgi:hypothetical protein